MSEPLDTVARVAGAVLPDLMTYVSQRLASGRTEDEAKADARALFSATTHGIEEYEAEVFR